MKIIGDTGSRELPVGRVVDIPLEHAKWLIEQGYAVPWRRREIASEHT